jgi:hypothetical protein
MPNEHPRARRLRRALDARLRGIAWIRIALAALAYLVYAYVNQGRPAGLDYFVPLADAFLHGRLAIPAESFLNELVPIGDGMGYVVYPPMPAVVLMPFVAAFGAGIDQAGISILLGALNVFLASGVLARLGLRREVWLALSLAFAFGSIGWYSAQSGSSWHFAHVCATFFMLLAIRGTQVDWPPWAIGIAYGAAGLSRLPVFLSAPFFVAYLVHRSRADSAGRPFGWARRITDADRVGRFDAVALVRGGLVFSAGVALLLLPYFAYNVARFGAPMEAGYDMIPGLLDEYQYRFGFFSVVNVPRNLYALLLTPPRLVEQAPFLQPALLGGMSILLTTPVFVWAIRSRSASWFVVGCWAAVGAILLPVLLHADPGGAQFGYRYAQDFYPFLLLLTAHGIGRLVGFEATLALALGFIVNAWGMWATTVNWFA